LKFADEKRLQIDEWVDETVTGVKKARLPKLGPLLDRMKADDMLIVSEISRLERKLDGGYEHPVSTDGKGHKGFHGQRTL
jgi:DNA invertase Pin-like site-specific DNA recombinase